MKIDIDYTATNVSYLKHRSTPVVMVDREGKLVGRFPSIGNAAKYLGCHSARICQCLTIKANKTCYGYIFLKEEEYEKLTPKGLKALVDRSFNIQYTKAGSRLKSINIKRQIKNGLFDKVRRKVICVEKNITFDSLTECAQHYGVRLEDIIVSAKTGRARKGFHFVYADDPNPPAPIRVGIHLVRDKNGKIIGRSARAIVAVRQDGQLAGWFESPEEAKKNCKGVHSTGIRAVLKGVMDSHHGLHWMYKDDFERAFYSDPESLKWKPVKTGRPRKTEKQPPKTANSLLKTAR